MTILAFLMQSWVGQLIGMVLGWVKDRQDYLRGAAEQMKDDVAAHSRDGEKSVELRNSYASQVDALRAEVEASNRAAAQSMLPDPVAAGPVAGPLNQGSAT
jgi:hypothetical protein